MHTLHILILLQRLESEKVLACRLEWSPPLPGRGFFHPPRIP